MRSNREFSDIDLARAQLIGDLRSDLGVNDEAVPIVLDLIDQIHGLRRLVRELVERSRR
jgi:chaperone modulatory protein CbpM